MTRWTNNWTKLLSGEAHKANLAFFSQKQNWRRVTNFRKSAMVKNWGLKIVSLFQGNLLLEWIISTKYIRVPFHLQEWRMDFPHLLRLFQLLKETMSFLIPWKNQQKTLRWNRRAKYAQSRLQAVSKFAEVVSWSICCSQWGPSKDAGFGWTGVMKFPFFLGNRMQIYRIFEGFPWYGIKMPPLENLRIGGTFFWGGTACSPRTWRTGGEKIIRKMTQWSCIRRYGSWIVS